MATGADKKRARLAFIGKRGVAAFHQRVNPILRRGGLEALFLAPSTPETRDYVAILTAIADTREGRGVGNSA
jgi:hypothetical protein